MQYVCGQMSRAAQKRNLGRGSQRLHRALGGTRILLAAAPTAPPCFCRWQRSSLLLFESTLAAPFSRQVKQKLRYPLDTGVLGGRGWIARAALLKTAHWAVFALSSATAPQLFESTLAVLCRSSNKTETPASSQRWSSWWARVDSNKLNYHNSLDAL